MHLVIVTKQDFNTYRITLLVSIPFAPPSLFILILPIESMSSKELGLHADQKLLRHTANILWHAFDVNKNIVTQNNIILWAKFMQIMVILITIIRLA